MMGIRKFFEMSVGELKTYLYDKFPIDISARDSSTLDYFDQLKTIFNVNAYFYPPWQKKFPNKVVKKNAVLLKEGYVGGKIYMELQSMTYRSTIKIIDIYSPEPVIQKITENK